MASPSFVPALVIVDLQEDFCPPHGSLAVTEGRDIAGPVNELLAQPSFAIRIATQDWHPENHISFATNHPGKKPFTDTATVINPHNPVEKYETRLWPVHCIQGSKGAELVPELDTSKVDKVIRKGQDARVEMYSAFYDPFKSPRVSDSGLVGILKEKGVTHVYVVGLAYDYCVKSTAVDAAREGFTTYVVEEATRAVADADGWAKCTRELEKGGVKVVRMHDEVVKKLKSLK
ncbi:Isochorismatase hydrolase [Cryphonectria parasitica EP155]|uniref:nicotinamidase n=1 Tax=Cryphonectria parasitica (strain ATCC 38755 / EP155) TaxID=660469 RepID=A0A9P5CMM9_CRYP1|nr:Isochorismatase hydrolase [Cryphonectria parasitica EP155]KAF3764283.1 Isochorismatase hydrolase [Cryphonectria parasitica EP155]